MYRAATELILPSDRGVDGYKFTNIDPINPIIAVEYATPTVSAGCVLRYLHSFRIHSLVNLVAFSVVMSSQSSVLFADACLILLLVIVF